MMIDDIIVVLFCFFMSTVGALLIFIPRKKAKSHLGISLFYSILFLIVGIYISHSIWFSKIEWQQVDVKSYHAKCNVFEQANLFVLDGEDINSFFEYENKLVEDYLAKGLNCIKQENTLRQEKFCNHVLRDFHGDFDCCALVVSRGKTSRIYLIDSGKVCKWGYKIYK